MILSTDRILVTVIIVVILFDRSSQSEGQSTISSKQIRQTDHKYWTTPESSNIQSFRNYQISKFKNATANSSNSEIQSNMTSTIHTPLHHNASISKLIPNYPKEPNITGNSIYLDQKIIDALNKKEEKVNQSIIEYKSHNKISHLGDRAINITREYVGQLNNYIQKLYTVMNMDPNLRKNNSFSNFLQKYKEKLTFMSKRLKHLKVICSLISGYYNLRSLESEMNETVIRFAESHNIEDIKIYCHQNTKARDILESRLNESRELNENGNDKLESLLSSIFTDLHNASYWKSNLDILKSETDCDIDIATVETQNIIYTYVQPFLHSVIFLVGFVSNVILVIIFFKNKDLHTIPNAMVLNLAIADILNLFVNITLFNVYFISNTWKVGEIPCIIFRFMVILCKYVCVYAVVATSLQKVIIFKKRFSRTLNSNYVHIRNRIKQIFSIVAVWIVGILFAVPRTLRAGIYDKNCSEAETNDAEYVKWILLFDLFALCFIPGIIISVSLSINSIRLKKSIQQIPGEQFGLDIVKRSREVSSNVLIGLIIVSSINHTPYILYKIICFFTGTQINDIVFFITYSLTYANSCFNPIALYIMCQKYRENFKELFRSI